MQLEDIRKLFNENKKSVFKKLERRKICIVNFEKKINLAL